MQAFTAEADASRDTSPNDASDPVAGRRNLRYKALCDAMLRQEFYLSHPVVSDDLIVATEPVREVFNIIQHLLIHRFPGSPFVGDFRMGKTQTIELVSAELRRIFPTIGIGTIIAKHHERPSEGAFYSDTLDDYGHGSARSGTAYDRGLRLLELIVGAVDSLGGNQYLFFIDEGQNWGVAEFEWMRDLTNKLQKRGIKCTTIVFAQEKLRVLRDMLLSTGRKDLIGRFFLKPRAFRGLNTEAELRALMAAFDDPSRHEYPEGSGICMSEFFLPTAYDGGWRLGGEAAALWARLKKVAEESGLEVKNVGMQWVMAAIRSWLFLQAEVDGALFTSRPESWVEAVDASEYESSLR
ncbi:hypothetical protein ACS5PN_03775 [Roseateles sp. NT4]|uniref:hypothetical protein n=1 Tax=Roseateles sp. NT4 TaxID=3453715 RepID=UPI003EEF66FC